MTRSTLPGLIILSLATERALALSYTQGETAMWVSSCFEQVVKGMELTTRNRNRTGFMWFEDRFEEAFGYFQEMEGVHVKVK